MAARVTTGRVSSASVHVLALGAVVVLMAVACASADRPRPQSERVVLPTPLPSLDAALRATVDRLEAALGAVGRRLDVAVTAYRPSEPSSLLSVPRVVLRADLADPSEGYVVVYRAPDPVRARELAQDMADYLGSGFGQTNFPADAQFSVRVMGEVVVFTWWSRSRSTDPARAQAVFEAVGEVGEGVAVRK